MTRSEYFTNLLSLFEKLIEESDIEKENQIQNQIENFIDGTYLEGRDAEKSCRDDLREIAHFYGGWSELKKVVAQLEDNDNEAAWERQMTDY